VITEAVSSTVFVRHLYTIIHIPNACDVVPAMNMGQNARNCLYGKSPASRMTHCDNFPQKRMCESEENNTVYMYIQYVDAFGKHARLLFSSNWIEVKKEIHTCGFCQKRGNAIAEKKRGGEGRHNTSKREREGLTLHESGGGGGAGESLVEL
jgi:hypothetical protein